MKRNALIAAIAAGLFSAAALAQWGPGAGYGPMMGPGMGGGAYGACGMSAGMLDALDLTADQRGRIATITDESQRQRLALMDEMHLLRSQGLRSGNADSTAMASLRERMRAAALQRRDAIDAVLTPEQRDRLHGSWRGPFARR